MASPSKKKLASKRPASRKSAAKKWVYLFSEVTQRRSTPTSWDGVRALLGGKGAGLADMTRVGLAGASGLHRHHRSLQRLPGSRARSSPRACGSRNWRRSSRIEKATGKKFGDPKNPLLVSCRSGRQVLHARHDGHGAQHRLERRDRGTGWSR